MKSTSKQAKAIILEEITSYHTIEEITDQVEHFFKLGDREVKTYYQGMQKMVWGGCFECYTSNMAEFLTKIYGAEKVEKLLKKHGELTTPYAHLLSREYAAIMRKEGRL